MIHLSSSKAVKFSEVVLDQLYEWKQTRNLLLTRASVSTSWSLRRPQDNEHTSILGRGREGGSNVVLYTSVGNRAKLQATRLSCVVTVNYNLPAHWAG